MDNTVLYAADINIHDEALLATLCIFYERILLPYVVFSPMIKQPHRLSPNPAVRAMEGLKDVSLEERWTLKANGWDMQHRDLFDAGIIERLSPPSGRVKSAHFQSDADLDALVRLGFAKRTDQGWKVNANLLANALRDDVPHPRLLLESQNRDHLKGAMATTVFSYLLPKLTELSVDDIVKLRRKVRDTREGFSMHLQTLSANIDSMLTESSPDAEVMKYAKSVVETKLIPDYEEFQRQLIAEQAGSSRKILERVDKIFQIDVSPSTLAFWPKILKALGFGFLETVEDRKQKLSNRGQAFQFMHEIDSR